MMFSIKLQTVIHFLQQEKQEQITRRLNHNFKTGKTLWRSVVSKLFLKNLFSFSRYRPSKSGTSAGSILSFTHFPKIIIGKPSSVMSQVIKAP